MLSLAQAQERPIPLDEIGAMKERFEEIIRAESSLTSLKRQLNVENGTYTEILRKLTDARTQAESNLEKVHLIENGKASPPVQILPKPEMIFAIGAILGLAVGLLFVLVFIALGAYSYTCGGLLLIYHLICTVVTVISIRMKDT